MKGAYPLPGLEREVDEGGAMGLTSNLRVLRLLLATME